MLNKVFKISATLFGLTVLYLLILLFIESFAGGMFVIAILTGIATGALLPEYLEDRKKEKYEAQRKAEKEARDANRI